MNEQKKSLDAVSSRLNTDEISQDLTALTKSLDTNNSNSTTQKVMKDSTSILEKNAESTDLLTDMFISNQPYLGSLFKSQNASTWEPRIIESGANVGI